MGTQSGVCPRVLLAQIAYDDKQHLLVLDRHVVPLSPTQYTLAAILLRQRQHWQETDGQAPPSV